MAVGASPLIKSMCMCRPRKTFEKYFEKAPYPAVSVFATYMQAKTCCVSTCMLPDILLLTAQTTLVGVKGLYCPEALVEVKAIALVA